MRPIRPVAMDGAPDGSAGQADQPLTPNTGDATMSTLITKSMPGDARNRKAWADFDLDSALDKCVDGAEDRNVRPDGFEITAGDSFAVLENHATPDGRTYHVLFLTDWSNYWSPWTTIYATVYDVTDPDDMAEFAREVAKWEAMPSEDPDAEWGDDESDDDDSDPDDESGPDDSPPVPSGWESVEGGGWTPGLRPSIPLHDMGLAELRAFADTLGIDGPRSAIPEDVRNTLYRWAMLSADSVCYAKQGLKDVYARIAAECDRLYDQLPERYRW